MGIFLTPLPVAIAFLANLAALVICYHAARSAPWKALNGPGAFSAWCAFIIALPLLWRFEVPIVGGAALHLLGMPLFVLMFGLQLAIAGVGLAVIAYTAIHDALWANLGMNLLLLAILPAYCGETVMRLTQKYFPHHIFVYLLGNGFFGAMAMLATIGVLSLGANELWVVHGPVGFDTVAYMLLLAWGESFLTGFLLTIFTVYRPEWVLTFDDDVYLRGK
ncbi:MAG TPA: energy-coupling factor ABC transporter permease [Noviherbaspirillum sp.]|nr:energy-coupling factor ABC transporter permease [Noviherbaspirillum sp.]